MTQKQFYKSPAWRKSRDAYIKNRISIDGGMCEVCGEELGKIVHHKIWLNDDNCNDTSIALSFSNYRYECQNCHNKEWNPLMKKHARVDYDEDGNLIFVK